MKSIAAIDQGNSSAKIAIFRDRVMVDQVRLERIGLEAFRELVKRHVVGGVIYSSVARRDERLLSWLRVISGVRVLNFHHSTPLPIKIKYSTPHTLGLDRIAAAVGAWSEHEGERLVVADAGTALTIDQVDGEGAFLGGNISPGVRMRLESLHRFTARLPRVEPWGETPPYGHDTETALRCGAVLGAAAEIAQGALHVDRIVLTGGDATLLAPYVRTRTEIPTELNDHLVAVGLLRIYEYNETN